jgi:hypothetical protein
MIRTRRSMVGAVIALLVLCVPSVAAACSISQVGVQVEVECSLRPIIADAPICLDSACALEAVRNDPRELAVRISGVTDEFVLYKGYGEIFFSPSSPHPPERIMDTLTAVCRQDYSALRPAFTSLIERRRNDHIYLLTFERTPTNTSPGRTFGSYTQCDVETWQALDEWRASWTEQQPYCVERAALLPPHCPPSYDGVSPMLLLGYLITHPSWAGAMWLLIYALVLGLAGLYVWRVIQHEKLGRFLRPTVFNVLALFLYAAWFWLSTFPMVWIEWTEMIVGMVVLYFLGSVVEQWVSDPTQS